MQIYNNVQSPNFGMLRAKAAIPALKDSAKSSPELVTKLNQAREQLKNTKYFHLEVGDKFIKSKNDKFEHLGCRIVGDKDAYFGIKSFKNAGYGDTKSVIMVKNDSGNDKYNITQQSRTIDKDFYKEIYREDYADYEQYSEHNEQEKWYPVYGFAGIKYNTTRFLDELVELVLQLDKAAVDNYADSPRGQTQTAKAEDAKLQAAVNDFENNLAE